MNKAHLGLGSNLGDRSANLAEAMRRLNDPPRVEVLRVSSVYETEPVGVSDQPNFLNLVVAISTSLTPHELLDHCLGIEESLGRVRRERWGPRTIDLDLLMFGDVVMDDDRLTLPHPRMAARSFVMVPLAEIAPETIVGGEPARDLAARLGDTGIKQIGSLRW